MPYTNKNGYVPHTMEEVMQLILLDINAQFNTSYSYDQFVGTGFYKFFYVLAQRIVALSVSFAEVYAKLQDYVRFMNEQINAPAVSPESALKILRTAGFTASVRPVTQDTAGELAFCVDLDDKLPNYAAQKQRVLDILKTCTAGGIYFAGTETGTSVLSNGQAMPYAFYLPTRYDVKLKLTISTSVSAGVSTPTTGEIKQTLLSNLSELYRLGINFEPEKYFTISRDAPYAAAVKLEYQKEAGGAWASSVYAADFKDLFVFDEENIDVVVQ